MKDRVLKLLLILSTTILFPSCKEEKENEKPLTISLERGKPIFFNYGLVMEPKDFLVVIPPSKESQVLLLENPHINQIKLNFLKRDSEVILGDHLGFDQRPINFRQFAIPITPFDMEDTLYLKVDKSMENLSLGMRIVDEVSFQNYQKQDDRIIGFVIGIFSLSILIGLILLPRIFSKKTIFFLLYILFSFFWLFNDAGLFYQFLWPKNPQFHSVSRVLFSTISMCLFAFYVYQNKNERINNTIKKIFMGIVVFIFFKLLFTFLLGLRIFPDLAKAYYISINSLILVLIFGLLICLLIKEFFKKNDAFFELGSIFLYCLFVFSSALSEIGLTIVQIPFLHRFDSLIFFGFQLIFMIVHIKTEETRQKLKALKEFTDFQILQEGLLKNRVIEVEEFERKRIAQNIHDDVGSIFAATKYLIQSLQEKFKLKKYKNDFIPILNLLDEGVKNQNSIIDDLIANFDQGESLEIAVEKKFKLIFSESGVKSEFKFFVSEQGLSAHQKSQLFRIFTELFTNTLKHGVGTTLVSIQIKDSNPLEIFYSDNGKNPVAKIPSLGKGLENIKFRIEQLQGFIKELKFKPGFRIEFQIPRTNEKNITLSD